MSDHTTLYIGNLGWNVTDDEFLAHVNGLCGQHNIVSAKVTRFPDSQRSKGWGLITFADATLASEGTAKLTGSSVGDRVISVRADRGPSEPSDRPPRPPRVERTPAASRAAAESPPASRAPSGSIFINNVPFAADEAALSAMFQNFSLESCTIQRKSDESSKGSAVVRLTDITQTQAAMDALQGALLDGRELRMRLKSGTSRNRRRKPGGGRAESAGEASTPAPSAGEVADGEETQVKRKRSRRRRGPRSSAQSEEGVIAEAAPAAASQAAEEGGRVRRRRRRAPRGASSSNRASNVFVRNLPVGTDSDVLQSLFAAVGAVSALVKTGPDGSFKSFGTVSFNSEDDAKAAIASMNGKNDMEVREDKPSGRQPRDAQQ